VSLAIVCSVTFEFGLFSYSSTNARVLAAQGNILGVALFAYVLAALFEERRLGEVKVKANEARLQKALVVGGVAAFDWDMRSDLLENSQSAAKILGIDSQQTVTASSFLARVHSDDRQAFKLLLSSIGPSNPSFSAIFRYTRPDGQEVWLEQTSKAEFDADGNVLRLEGLMLDITDRKRADEHQRLLVSELDHRVKNVLAQVSAVANSTRRGSGSMDQFLRSLDGRIQSMAAAHTLLSESGWQSVGLHVLVRTGLAPYLTDTNVIINGTDVALTSDQTQAVAKVLHELATNAAKYGALSTSGGQVSVNWDCKPNGRAAILILVWRESGGPELPSRIPSGYGTNLIRNLIPHELGGRVDLVFAAKGVNCRIEIPVKKQGVNLPLDRPNIAPLL
jgi:PAS domain S-box-containing protein